MTQELRKQLEQGKADVARPNPTESRYLEPATTVVHRGTHGVLHVTIQDERIYGGVHAELLFPVRYPDRYISMRHTNSEGEEIEVGLIRNLADWPAEAQALIRESLKRRYFLHVIRRINTIGWKWGFVALDVDTDKGQRSFLMRWRGDRAVAFGQSGKVLIDVDDNRYLIPDLSALSTREQNSFLRYIYW